MAATQIGEGGRIEYGDLERDDCEMCGQANKLGWMNDEDQFVCAACHDLNDYIPGQSPMNSSPASSTRSEDEAEPKYTRRDNDPHVMWRGDCLSCGLESKLGWTVEMKVQDDPLSPTQLTKMQFLCAACHDKFDAEASDSSGGGKPNPVLSNKPLKVETLSAKEKKRLSKGGPLAPSAKSSAAKEVDNKPPIHVPNIIQGRRSVADECMWEGHCTMCQQDGKMGWVADHGDHFFCAACHDKFDVATSPSADEDAEVVKVVKGSHGAKCMWKSHCTACGVKDKYGWVPNKGSAFMCAACHDKFDAAQSSATEDERLKKHDLLYRHKENEIIKGRRSKGPDCMWKGHCTNCSQSQILGWVNDDGHAFFCAACHDKFDNPVLSSPDEGEGPGSSRVSVGTPKVKIAAMRTAKHLTIDLPQSHSLYRKSQMHNGPLVGNASLRLPDSPKTRTSRGAPLVDPQYKYEIQPTGSPSPITVVSDGGVEHDGSALWTSAQVLIEYMMTKEGKEPSIFDDMDKLRSHSSPKKRKRSSASTVASSSPGSPQRRISSTTDCSTGHKKVIVELGAGLGAPGISLAKKMLLEHFDLNPKLSVVNYGSPLPPPRRSGRLSAAIANLADSGPSAFSLEQGSSPSKQSSKGNNSDDSPLIKGKRVSLESHDLIKKDHGLKIFCTDIPEIMPILQNNIHENGVEDICDPVVLRWGNKEETQSLKERILQTRGEQTPMKRSKLDSKTPLIDYIIASDVCYEPEKSKPLLKTILDLATPMHTKIILALVKREHDLDAFVNAVKSEDDHKLLMKKMYEVKPDHIANPVCVFEACKV